ncbi:phage tail length tape measure family protein [Rhizobium sp. NTR19]|uniref:Phage tail length tape measure family protein n=1 Tax=Neorhizobium turbinariae TaxID=2937795 RepID=A0ABT0IMI4_9HYPH|nr:phage tail length tape measure family protein [Neorhizobium turbinariae]MCK8779090.1 phage tail length tape measure family protein [Neorhizobium turbinariae]
MATDNEQLVLSISADVRQIQRQLKGLVGQTQRDTKAIEAAFGGIDKAASGAFAGVAANSNRAFGAGVNGAKQFERAVNTSRLQTANLAAQLNDIGVQLAGGQSPFLIALQQGTQINQVLGQGGARAAVGALAGAFTSLINPVSLATIAIIALGGEAIQYFTSLLSEGDKSEEMLKQQAQLIQQVADRWGDAVPALREYADELERTARAAQLNEAGGIVNERELAPVRKQIEDAAVAVADLVSQLQSAGEETETIVALQEAFNKFSSAAEDGSLKLEDVQAVQDTLAAAINSSGIPALSEFKSMFDQLTGSALNASDAVRQTNAAIAQAQARMNDPNTWRGRGLIGQPEGAIQGSSDPDLPFEGPTINRRPLVELEGLPGASRSASRAASEREKAAKAAEREKQAVTDLIEQLQFEQAALSMTNEERAVANALRRAGTAATPEQRAQIQSIVEATYAERDAIRANKEAMEELRDVSRDVFEGIVSDLRNGKSGADILSNALDRLADRLISSAFDGLFDGTSGGKGGLFGGKIIPGILHSGGVAGSDGYGHGRAVSPSVFAGAKRYHKGGVAGLMPGEVPAILQRGEVVIPRGAKAASGGGMAFTYAPQIDARGADAAAVARLEQVVAKQQTELQGRVEAAVRSAQKRNVKLG